MHHLYKKIVKVWYSEFEVRKKMWRTAQIDPDVFLESFKYTVFHKKKFLELTPEKLFTKAGTL